MRDTKDILVVGGGPAGLTLAILARQMHMTVTVLESVLFPRLLYGQTLPASAEGYFAQMGIPRERLCRDAVIFRSQRIRWNRTQDFVNQGQPLGLEVPRQFLEPMLQERALALGVNLIQPCMAKKVIMEKGRVVGIGADRGEYFGRLVADCAGGRHWLTRKLGQPMEYYSPPLFGYYLWARGHCEPCHEQPLIYSQADGWVWISRVGPDLYQGTRFSYEADPEFRHWIPREFEQARLDPIGPARSADMTWRLARQVAGPGYVLLGDAMRGMDPLMSRGIEQAMGDAFRLGHLLGRQRAGEMTPEDVGRSYEEEVRTAFLECIQGSYRWLRSHPRPPQWACQESYFHRQAALV